MKQKRVSSVFIFLLAALLILVTSLDAKAASKKYQWNPTKAIGGAKFYTEEVADDEYELYMKKGKEAKLLIPDMGSEDFYTNGKYVIYINKGTPVGEPYVYEDGEEVEEIYSYKRTIYRLNVNTGKKQKIISGTNYMIANIDSTGTWVYCGPDESEGIDKLYAVNVKTRKKRYMENYAGLVECASNRVLVTPTHGDVGNYGITIYKINGKRIKNINKASYGKIKGKKIYYVSVKIKKDKTYYRIYRCNLNGKKEKALTKWKKNVPKKYSFIWA